MIYGPCREGTSGGSGRSPAYVLVLCKVSRAWKKAIHPRSDRERIGTQTAFQSHAQLCALPFEYFSPFKEQAVRNEQKSPP